MTDDILIRLVKKVIELRDEAEGMRVLKIQCGCDKSRYERLRQEIFTRC